MTLLMGRRLIPTRQVADLPPASVSYLPIPTNFRDLKKVALTFDDGPSPASLQIMAILKDKQVPATFFVVGKNVDQYPDVLRQELRAGYEVGSHTNTHPSQFWRFVKTPASFTKDAIIANEKIYQQAGFYPHYFRFPYGWHNQILDNQLKGLGMTIVAWNVDPEDWSKPGKDKIISRIDQAVLPNSVILFHDGPASQDRSQTIAALPGIIDLLKNKGYEIVSLDKIDLNNLQVATPAALTKQPPTKVKTQQIIITAN